MKRELARILDWGGAFLRSPSNATRRTGLAWRRLFPKDREAARVASWIHGDLPRVPLVDLFHGLASVDVTVARPYDRTIGTSVDLGELLALAAIVRHTAARRILEIGTFDGNTTLNLALNAPPDARVTTVDLPPDWDGRLGHEIEPCARNVTERSGVGRQFRDSPCAERIVQVFGDSARLDWSTLGGPFDFVFIDGCHAYAYVESDTRNALACMRPGGVIAWHDYGEMADVSRCVDEFAPRLGARAVRGTRLAVGFAPA